MKKIIFLTMVSSLACHAICQAGSMGAASTQMPSKVFASAEGAYTWNQISSYSINTRTVNPSSQYWGGRVAGGMLHPITDKLQFSSEIGGGYYGGAKLNIPPAGTFISAGIDGYDALIGLIYKLSYVDVFGDVGFMAQNLRVKTSVNAALQDPGGVFNGVTVSKFNTTQVFPELKVGGIFNLNDNWGVSLAYMHVFGTVLQNSFSTASTSSPTTITQNGESDIENPTLNSIMLGIRYSV